MASTEPDLRSLTLWHPEGSLPGQLVEDGVSLSELSLNLKRAVDIVGALGLLVLLLPLLGLVALAVCLSSPGPVLFRQRRIGQHAQEFVMYKFRTMRVGAHEEQERLAQADPERIFLKLEEDHRVTRVGAVLRRYSLDELPQLLNVLRGEMSLIGPRPLLPSDYEKFPRNGWMGRFEMKPGMSGLWQVSGRSLCSEAERMQLDLEYVQTWSLALDLRIALRTPRAVVSGRGAY